MAKTKSPQNQQQPLPSKSRQTYHDATDFEPWAPSFSLAFKILCVCRLVAATYSNISDCDEVFNYWEPTHYLQYGYGMQTWEYAPQYAIRSWSYISIHAAITRLFEVLLTKEKMVLFYEMRGVLAITSAFCEAKLYAAICSTFGRSIGRYFLVASIFSTGMFISAAAFLPSSFAMYAVTLAAAFSLTKPSRSRTYSVILVTAIGATVGWPFGAATVIPFAIEELFFLGRHLHRARLLIEAALIAFVCILVPLVAVDYFFYQKLTVVPLNIVLYNVFGGKDKGPNIFGTEPWWFYILNCLLNFNILFPAAMVFLPLHLLNWYLKGSSMNVFARDFNRMLLFRSLTVYLWFAIFSLQPHKEERFLFVIYPLILLNGALSVRHARNWIIALGGKLFSDPRQAHKMASAFVTLFWTVFALLSISRTLALYTQYHAPLSVMAHARTLPAPDSNSRGWQESTLCIGKEWYRFPSHYFLPQDTRLRFVKSSFSGLLPKYFPEVPPVNGSMAALRHTPRLTHLQVDGVNDINAEEMDRYVELSQCDYILDYTPPGQSTYNDKVQEPLYALDASVWSKHYCEPFLDSASSRSLARAFYIPGVGGKSWGEYCLLRRNSTR
ncbi:putative alpha-1,2-mannosyltransferase [Phlyctochytrium arcticum]|nr:putative alpha-1,2-mannosyltransferase [Phlyctochytrium arcticum]